VTTHTTEKPVLAIVEAAKRAGVPLEDLAKTFGRATSIVYGPPPYDHSLAKGHRLREPLNHGVRARLLTALEHIVTDLYEWHAGDCIPMGQPESFKLSLDIKFPGGRGFGHSQEGPL
jgi:hypothetical protein